MIVETFRILYAFVKNQYPISEIIHSKLFHYPQQTIQRRR